MWSIEDLEFQTKCQPYVANDARQEDHS